MRASAWQAKACDTEELRPNNRPTLWALSVPEKFPPLQVSAGGRADRRGKRVPLWHSAGRGDKKPVQNPNWACCHGMVPQEAGDSGARRPASGRERKQRRGLQKGKARAPRQIRKRMGRHWSAVNKKRWALPHGIAP